MGWGQRTLYLTIVTRSLNHNFCMKGLVIALVLFGLGCTVKAADVTKPIAVADIKSINEPVSVETIQQDALKGWNLTDEAARYYSGWVLESRPRVQPFLFVAPGEEHAAQKKWNEFANAFPYQLKTITLEPKIFVLTKADTRKAEPFPDRLQFASIKQRIGELDDYTFPVVYWLDESIGMGDEFDAASGLFVRYGLNGIPQDREITFLQWLAAVHK